MSKRVSYSVTPVGWHQQVVSSFQTQARASSSRSRPPGTISAAGVTAGVRSVGGVKANSASVPFGASSSPDRPAGGSSSRRRLTICGRRRPALTITTPPCCGSLPSTQANGTATGPPNGIARVARIRTSPRAGGCNSTSQDSPPPPASPPRSIRRTVSVPPPDGSNDHSRRSSVGSEKWTTTASSADAPGRQENVNDSVIRSSTTVSRTCVSASTGGRRSRRLAGAAMAASSTGIQARMAVFAVSAARRSGGDDGGGCGGSISIVVSGGEVRASTASPAVSPSSRTMSISAPVNGSSVVMPARCPAIESVNPRCGVAAVGKPICNRSPRPSRTTRQSSDAIMAARSPPPRRSIPSTESMNHPGAIRPVTSKASPLRTRRSHAVRPVTTVGTTSTVVTRATSRSAPRGATPTRTLAWGDCASSETIVSIPSGCLIPRIGQPEVFSSATGRQCSKPMSTSASPGSHSTRTPPPAHSVGTGHSNGNHPASGSSRPPASAPWVGSGATALIVSGARVPRLPVGSRTSVASPVRPHSTSAGRSPRFGSATVADTGRSRGSASRVSTGVRHGAVGTMTAVSRASPRPTTTACQQPNWRGDSFAGTAVNGRASIGPTSIRQTPSAAAAGAVAGIATAGLAQASPSINGTVPGGVFSSIRVRRAGSKGIKIGLPSSAGGNSHWKR